MANSLVSTRFVSSVSSPEPLFLFLHSKFHKTTCGCVWTLKYWTFVEHTQWVSQHPEIHNLTLPPCPACARVHSCFGTNSGSSPPRGARPDSHPNDLEFGPTGTKKITAPGDPWGPCDDLCVTGMMFFSGLGPENCE